MNKHTISKEDFKDFEFAKQLAGSFGAGEHKELKALVKGNEVRYEVLHHRKVVFKSISIDYAIENYNSL